jgi:hypothetical protein
MTHPDIQAQGAIVCDMVFNTGQQMAGMPDIHKVF